MAALLSDAGVWRACGGRADNFPPWRFLLLGCGTDRFIRQDLVPVLPQQPLTMPSLHVAGEQDSILSESLSLSRRFDAPVVVQHKGGHSIPITLAAESDPVRVAVHHFVNKWSSRS